MSVQFLGGTRTGAGGQPLPFSPAVTAGPFVFVSGQVAMGDNGELVPGGIEAQTRQTLKNVEKALALAGCTLNPPSGWTTRATSGRSIASTPNSFPRTNRRDRRRRRR